MKKKVTYLLLCAVLILGLMPAAAFADEIEPDDIRNTVLENPNPDIYPDVVVSTPLAFSDVTPADWFYNDVNNVVGKGLMNGVGEGFFAPYGYITRGMAATMIYRLEGEPAFMNDNTYTDVAEGSYYEKAIVWCSSGKTEIVLGYGNDLFGPDDNITREQLAKMLYNYACYKGFGFRGDWVFRLDFADCDDISDWAVEALSWCTMNGIINGYEDGNLRPQGTATRAEAAKMFTTFMDKIESESDIVFIGDFENSEGCRVSVDDNRDGTFTVNARIVPENPEFTNALMGKAKYVDGGLDITFFDPNGNPALAVLETGNRGYDLTFTGSMWDAVETGTVFKDFAKKTVTE